MLFTGKGGVGKTTVAAATAHNYASEGYRTILVSSDPAHSTDDTLGVDIGLSTVQIAPNFWARNINAEVCAKKFVSKMNKSMEASFSKLIPGFDVDLLSETAMFPGMDEYFALEEILNLIQSAEYDIIVFDTAPTGHTLKALTAPDYIRTFILRILRMKAKIENLKGFVWKKDKTAANFVPIMEEICNKIERLKDILKNPDFVSINLISIATESGFQECYRTIRFLENLKIPTQNLIINNIIPNFGEETWKTAGENMATALMKCEYDNQQPHLHNFKKICRTHNLNLVGVPRLPYEPRCDKLADYAKLLWNDTGLKNHFKKSLIIKDNKIIVNVPYIDKATWGADNLSYMIDEFTWGAEENKWYKIDPDISQGEESFNTNIVDKNGELITPKRRKQGKRVVLKFEGE